MAAINIAIDLGGTNVSIYTINQGLVLKEPTLVAVRKNGDEYTLLGIGDEARRLQESSEENITIFTPVVDGIIKSTEYMTVILKYFLSKVIEKTFFKPYINAIVTVPCGISEEEKIAYEDVCYEAKISKVTLIPTVLAAYYGSGKSIHSSHTLVICDMGGSHTEIACVNSNKIIKGSTLGIGGKSIDRYIASVVAEKYGVTIDLASARMLKEEIGSLYQNDKRSTEIFGYDEVGGNTKTIVVSSDDIVYAITPFIEQICLAIETNITICPQEMIEDIVRGGILLTGGLSGIPGIDKFLISRLKIPISIVHDPENAAILGAGRLLKNEKELKDIINKF